LKEKTKVAMNAWSRLNLRVEEGMTVSGKAISEKWLLFAGADYYIRISHTFATTAS